MTQDKLEFIPLHETFGAECRGADLVNGLSPDLVKNLQDGLHKYGVLVFRETGLSDEQYIEFGKKFGSPHVYANKNNRLNSNILSDPSNLHSDGSIIQRGELQYFVSKATGIFHVDKSYNPRRVRYTTIKATEPPPPGTGGATEFADTRTAYEDLDDDTKKFIEDKIAAHSIFESRRKAAPSLKTFQLLDPKDYPMGKFSLVQEHKPTGRKNLYLAGHIHHLENMDEQKSRELVDRLFRHASQPKYVLKIFYDSPGDITIWDNLAVMHRAGGGDYVGKYRRDVRNITIYDNSDEEWGFNDRNEIPIDPMVYIKAAHAKAFGNDQAKASVQDEMVDWD